MFKDAFAKLDPVQSAQMAVLINPHLDRAFDPQDVTIMIHDLPFYAGYFLAEISDHSEHPAIVRTCICNEHGAVHVLTWTNDPIYRLNKSVPIHLTPKNVESYARFFLYYVRGQHGRFSIIDTVDDIDWKEEPSPAGRKALSRMIQPLTCLEHDKTNGFKLRASVVYKDALFQSNIHITPQGVFSMTDEELMVESLPVSDDLIGV
jgi:hypothetical protein